MTLSMTMALLGGLALFLYGMKLMGEGLEKAAGDRLKRLLEALTRNPLMGLLVGVLCLRRVTRPYGVIGRYFRCYLRYMRLRVDCRRVSGNRVHAAGPANRRGDDDVP